MSYPKGTQFKYANLKFQKMGDKEFDWWICLNSTYTVEYLNEKNEICFKRVPESEKPLYDDKGRLNRYGFKWTDEQIKKQYDTVFINTYELQ
jgi:hypothetical protein